MSVNKYNLKIDQTPLSCCTSRLLQFLFLELKTELKEFVPKGIYENIQPNTSFEHFSKYHRSQNSCKNSF